MHPFPQLQRTAICLLMAGALSARAAPIIFENQPGWAGGVIDGHIGGDPAAPQTILITADHTLPKGLSVLQPEAKRIYQSLRFKGATAEGRAEMRTLTLQGPLSVDFGGKGRSPPISIKTHHL